MGMTPNPQTAPATSVVAGNGAPRWGKGPADDGAPASDPADVGSGEGRADVAPDCPWCDCGFYAEPHPCSRTDRPAVARTLDVAEATADKARAVGLARETAS